MGMSVEERARVKIECLRMLTRLDLEPSQKRFLSGFIDTYLRLTAQESLLFEAQADRLLNRMEKSEVMELTTSWKEEGLVEGRKKGQLEMALRLLRRRCGALPDTVESKVRTLTVSDLEALGEAVLDFTGLTDLERWLQAR
jgi:Domain of unknown function (DUF4351)